MTLTSADVRAFIEHKRRGGEHSAQALEAFIGAFVQGAIDEGPMAAWLMAVCLRGMSLEETTHLTRAMAGSGEKIDWSGADAPIVDKHSTGGVSDGVSLISVPLAAAGGAKVAKLSGRALGFTGGTLDKLECIPGLRTELDIAAFKRQVVRVGCAIASASPRLAPADKKMYSLRDRTGTVESIPLIAASIMSKKIAGGAPAIVLDVKVGSGAFMQTLDEARKLGTVMAAVGERLGRRVRVVLSSMEEPLGSAVGDALELDEALRVLERVTEGRLREAALAVSQTMLSVSGAEDPNAARALGDGSALKSFQALVEAQGGRLDAFDRRFVPRGAIEAPESGFVSRIDARAVGEAVAFAKVRHSHEAARRIGVRLQAHVGDRVERGQPVLEWFADVGSIDVAALGRAISIGDAPAEPLPLILDEIGVAGPAPRINVAGSATRINVAGPATRVPKQK